MRRLLALSALLALAGCGQSETPRDADRPAARTAPAATQPAEPRPFAHLGAQLVRRTQLRRSPGGHLVRELDRKSRWGGPAILAVTERRDGWVGVLHHALPNGRTGWVPEEDVKLVREPWALEVDLSERRGLVKLHGKVVDRFSVAVGRPEAPTPTGTFGVTDRLTTTAGSPYGCCILALSGTQPNTPPGWPGGNRIGIHGTAHEDSIGTAASAGCLRMRDGEIRMLMRRIPVGARVVIKA